MILAGTGHRPSRLGGYGDDVFSKLVDLGMWAISEYQPSKIISGMAQGWDQALAEAAIRSGCPFVAAIPFTGQESVWPPAAKERYSRLVKSAATAIVITGGDYSAYKMQARNAWMVDNADGILALWNGTSGGTANCVRYAEANQKPVFNLWDRWVNIPA